MSRSAAKRPLLSVAPGFYLPQMWLPRDRNMKELHRQCCSGWGSWGGFLLAAVQRAEVCQHLCLARTLLLAGCWEEQTSVPWGPTDGLCHPSQLRCWRMLLVGPSHFEWAVKKYNKKHIIFWKKWALPISHNKAAVCNSVMFATPPFLLSEPPQRLLQKIWQDYHQSHHVYIVLFLSLPF